MTSENLRRRVWELLEVTEDSEGGVSWDWVDVFLLILIVLNVIAVIIETVRGIRLQYGPALYAFDVFSVAVFSVEYVTRIWACTADPRYSHPVTGRIRYATSFFGIIDALAIVPFYMMLLLPITVIDLRVLRVLRLMRFARVLKVGRYSESFDRMKRVISARRGDLGVALMSVLVVLILASSAMYYTESAAQPTVFTSIPAAMWWGISTLTTVGYGDIAPVTPLGKLLGGMIQLLGIAVFALPAGIIAAGYDEESRRRRSEKGVCHTCGQALGDSNVSVSD